MRLNLLFLALLLSLNHGKAVAQDKSKVIDTWLNDNIHQLGGRAILIIYKDNQIVYSHAVNNINSYSPTTRLPIASCSKWLSAALLMTFVDEGKITLKDTVGKYLPMLSLHGKGKITIAQCLSHLTAIKPPSFAQSFKDINKMKSIDQAIQLIAALPMEGEPGQVFHYSSIGLQIIAAVLEKVEGKSYATLFAQRIARPLNMVNTDFGKSAVAHAAGGAYSTAQDYINFLRMILNKGTFDNKRILTESSISEMQINRLTTAIKISGSPANIGAAGYGFGEWVMGKNVVSSPGLFGSYPWVDYDKKYAAVLMTVNLNQKGRQQLYHELKKLIDDSIK